MDWSVQDAHRLYNIANWGSGYFDIDAAGHLCALPLGAGSSIKLDLCAIARELQTLGLQLPALIRFSDILHHRTQTLDHAFHQAMDELGYTGGYTPAYPIKVNQQKHVIEEIVATANIDVALEVGSKAELLAAIALAPTAGTIICNGYKDAETLRIALTGQLLGLKLFIVIEKLSELDLVMAEADRLGVTPRLGLRARLDSIASGNWQNSGGDKSKFGLTAGQILQLIDSLRQHGWLDALQLLHVHIGSQIPNLDDIETGLHEAARFFVELHAAGANIRYMDVGGGLGVDYEGTASTGLCSMNYNIEAYARCVVNTFAGACSDHQLPAPHLLTEAGRAMTAHHAIIITHVIHTERPPDPGKLSSPAGDDPDCIGALRALMDRPNRDNGYQLDALNNAMRAVHRAFAQGLINLRQRARAEAMNHAIVQRLRISADQAWLEHAGPGMADKVLCNFSLFQTVPDSWAIDQIFPILPLQRLNEMPDRRTTIHDLTCDSDGRINHFAGPDGITDTLPLHSIADDEEYLIGIFMVGAYQEILGDVHNLFGELNSVHVEIRDDGSHQLTNLLRGDSVASVLNQVNINARELREELDRRIAATAMDSEMQIRCSEILEQGMNAYTYMKNGDVLRETSA